MAQVRRYQEQHAEYRPLHNKDSGVNCLALLNCFLGEPVQDAIAVQSNEGTEADSHPELWTYPFPIIMKDGESILTQEKRTNSVQICPHGEIIRFQDLFAQVDER